MLVDKYEVMWFGSQKSVRWFCLDLLSFKKKKPKKPCIPLLQITKHFPVLLFLYPPMAPLKLRLFWQSSSLLSRHHTLAFTFPDSSSQSPVLASLPLTFPWIVVILRVPSLNSILFIYVSSLEISFIATTSKAICRVDDKPQIYIFTPYFFLLSFKFLGEELEFLPISLQHVLFKMSQTQPNLKMCSSLCIPFPVNSAAISSLLNQARSLRYLSSGKVLLNSPSRMSWIWVLSLIIKLTSGSHHLSLDYLLSIYIKHKDYLSEILICLWNVLV